MFFVAAGFGGDISRTFDVPAGEPLLVPILNDASLQFNGRGPNPLTGGKGAANQGLADWTKSVSDLFLTIDGAPVSNLQSDYVRTSWFSAGQVEPGSGSLAAANSPPLLVGDLSPSKSAGFWSVISGLSPGIHHLDFGGATTTGFSLAIHDRINVV
jgi:hypothetical protein